MSLLPLFFFDWREELQRPHSLLDQDFGLGLHPEQLVTPRRLELCMQPLRHPHRRSPWASYIRPWAELLRTTERGGVSTIEADKEKFQVTLDVQQFKPDEIDIKLLDRYIVVNAKHEERRDEHGWISREFTRKYLVPEQCDIDQVQSKLSSDGVLSITAPRKEQRPSKNHKVIKIEQTGKPALSSKEEEPTEEQTI